MIMILNLGNNEKINYYLTKEKIEYLTSFLSDIENLDDKVNNNYKECLQDILFNLFSTEYIHLDLNLLVNEELSKNNNNSFDEIIKFFNSKKDRQSNKEIQGKKEKKIVELLFDLENNNFLNFNSEKLFDFDENFYHNLEIVENITLILFSKEKYKYLNNNEKVYYEYNFLNKVILVNILKSKEINGDKYKDLFRKDSLSNDIIKYLFFIFGNQLIIECLVKPIDIILNITGINNEFEIINKKGKSLNMERDITKEEYNILFDKILEKMSEHIPYFFKILLKMIYNNVKQNFTIEKDNFIPIGVVLIFNFIASPRIQKIFSIHPNKYTFIKSMNRLLCNTCFNLEFGQNDDLKIFNNDIKIYHEKLNKFFKSNIMNIEPEDIENKKYLKNLFNHMNVEYPSFLFNLSCNFLENITNVNNNQNEE